MISEDTKEESPKAEEASLVPTSTEVPGSVSAEKPPAESAEETVEDIAGQRRWMVACLALLIVGGAFFGYRRWLRPARRQAWLRPGVSGGSEGSGGGPSALLEQAPAADDAVLAMLTPLRQGGAIANGRITRITGVHRGAVYLNIRAGSQDFVLTISRAEAALNSMRAGPYALDLVSGPPGPVAMQLSQMVLQALQTNVRVPVPSGMTVR